MLGNEDYSISPLLLLLFFFRYAKTQTLIHRLCLNMQYRYLTVLHYFSYKWKIIATLLVWILHKVDEQRNIWMKLFSFQTNLIMLEQIIYKHRHVFYISYPGHFLYNNSSLKKSIHFFSKTWLRAQGERFSP